MAARVQVHSSKTGNSTPDSVEKTSNDLARINFIEKKSIKQGFPNMVFQHCTSQTARTPVQHSNNTSESIEGHEYVVGFNTTFSNKQYHSTLENEKSQQSIQSIGSQYKV